MLCCCRVLERFMNRFPRPAQATVLYPGCGPIPRIGWGRDKVLMMTHAHPSELAIMAHDAKLNMTVDVPNLEEGVF